MDKSADGMLKFGGERRQDLDWNATAAAWSKFLYDRSLPLYLLFLHHGFGKIPF